jgi:hypothetical protein
MCHKATPGDVWLRRHGVDKMSQWLKCQSIMVIQSYPSTFKKGRHYTVSSRSANWINSEIMVFGPLQIFPFLPHMKILCLSPFKCQKFYAAVLSKKKNLVLQSRARKLDRDGTKCHRHGVAQNYRRSKCHNVTMWQDKPYTFPRNFGVGQAIRPLWFEVSH